MKKNLLSLAAFMFVSTFASAQLYTAPAGVLQHSQSTTLKTINVVAKAAPMKALGENQAYLGPYTTDEVASSEEGLGLPSKPGQVKVGALLSSDMMSSYKGCKIVGIRAGLANAVGKITTFAAPTLSNGNFGANIFEETIASTKQGWNEATVTTDYTIGTDDELLIGFEYTQTSSTQASTSYPISLVGTGYNGGFLCYTDLGQGTGWYNMGTSYGCVSIQLIVENENGFAKTDGAMDDISFPKYLKVDEEASLLVGAHAKFSATFKNVVFGVKLNGKEVGTFNNISTETGKLADVTGTSAGFFGNFKFTADQLKAVGEDNELSVYIKSIDGEDPVNTDDDEISTTFKAYSESVEHQKALIEHFTSQYCTYCPLGINLLETLNSKRNDLAWVSIHGDMQTGNDIYTLSSASYILSFAASGFPSAAFNRYMVPSLYGGESLHDGYLAMGLGYNQAYHSQVADMLSSTIDMYENDVPSFATVDLNTTYDESSRTLKINVSGEGVENAQKLLGSDAVLTVYLTEDGLVARQLNQGTWVSKYTHNNVLRKIVSASLGDAINWNGNKYENSYETVIPTAQNPENMHVVAFISRPIVYSSSKRAFETAIDEAWVNNVNSVKLGEASGISNAIMDNANAKEVARYTLDGTKVSAPVKGLNIVKMNDGRIVKVMVK